MCTGYGLLHMTHNMKLAARTRTEVHMLHTCHYLRTLKSRSWLADGAVGNWTSVMRAPDQCTLRSLAVTLRSLAARNIATCLHRHRAARNRWKPVLEIGVESEKSTALL